VTTWTANSEISLQSLIGDLREMFATHKFLKVSAKTGKARTLDQNAISHTFYDQLARELKEDDALGWKCYCKLHHGVPILRAEDDDYREVYDIAIKPRTYEEKLQMMKYWPVTRLMTTQQLSKYLEAMQADFAKRCVWLEFPKEQA
jgi:hypothetical protein